MPFGTRPLPGLFAGGQATLELAFAWLPILLAGTVPALTMGVWAEERRSGTEELLLTWPVSTAVLVAAKFTGRLLAVLALLVAVYLPLVAAVRWLGPLDLGAAAAAAIGVAELAAACVAIGCLVSTLAREPLVAYLVASLMLLGMLGLGILSNLAGGWLGPWLWSVSPQAHFMDTAARGLVDTADAAHAAGLVALALLLSWVAVERRRVA